MGTKVDDYHLWAAAVTMYDLADAADRLAQTRTVLARVLRTLGRDWPVRRADELDRQADDGRRYARAVRVRALRLTGIRPWWAGSRDVAAR